MADLMVAVGIDVGGTRIKAVAMRADGSVVERRVESSADNAGALVGRVAALAKEWMDKTNAVTLRMHQMVGIARTLQARASNIRNFALHDGTGTGTLSVFG